MLSSVVGIEWHDHCSSVGFEQKGHFMKRIAPIALLGIFIATAVHSQALPFEDIGILDRQVAVIANAHPIDPRLKLARCPEKAIIAPPIGGAVVVRCLALGWRILVPLTQSALSVQPKELRIHKGDAIELIIDSEGFEVSAPAIAMQDGAIGDNVRVKTLTAAVILTGTVTRHGTVRISD
jgi:flagellar basal body P-ring formation protein FlgA